MQDTTQIDESAQSRNADAIVNFLTRVVRESDPASASYQFARFWLTVSCAVGHAIVNAPESKGYEPFLTRYGMSPGIARLYAAIIVRRATRIAREARVYPSVARAIRFMAKPRRNRSATARNLDVLIDAVENTAIFDMIETESGVGVPLVWLKAARDGDRDAAGRICQMASVLAPRLRTQPGPPVSVASVAHENLLRYLLPEIGVNTVCTWSALESRCLDQATLATQREFDLQSFDPRPACRSIKRFPGEWRDPKFLKDS
jgi:hypothetical protein